MRTIGILHSGSNAKHFHDSQISGLMNGLLSVGVDSTNTTITTLFAKDHTGKTLRGHADDLATTLAAVAETKVFVAAGGTLCAATAMAAIAGRNIPVVFTSVRDPDSPAANMTGVCARTTELDETRLRLLHEYLPAATDFGVLVNSARGNYAVGSTDRTRLDHARGALNPLDYQDVNVGGVSIRSAFQGWAAANKHGAVVTADPFFNDNRDVVISRATIPAIYQWREFVELGGLMSYGPRIYDAYKAAGKYAGRIINGEALANMPVVVLSRFELVINEGTAYALGKPIPQTLRDRADEIL
jgi:putative tryptophan/tyrosine transport system substrate-binding protein